MPKLHIVLVQPQIPQNTGNIARTCAVTGAALHLVRPYGFVITDKHLRRAGLDYWDKLEISEYDSLQDFMTQHGTERIYYFTTKSRICHSDVQYGNVTQDVWLMFGREDAGLPESLMVCHPETAVRIPMRPALRSLNLSNSVAIAVYEVLRQWGYPGMDLQGNLTEYTW